MGGFNCPQTFARAFDNNGAPAPGAKLYAFLAGTTIPKNLYFDFDLTQPCPHPLVADSDGNFEQYFLEGGAYKLSLFDQDDNQLRPPEEPIYGTGSVSAATLADVIANSDEIVWTEDEGDQLSGHLVWPLHPPPSDKYITAYASEYRPVKGGAGYGEDEIVARRDGYPDSRCGLILGWSGVGSFYSQVGFAEGTHITFQEDVGGTGIDAHGIGAFKFDSLRVGDLAGGGAGVVLPVGRDNDGDLVPRTASEFRGDIGISVADGQVARGTTGGAVTSDAGMAYTLSGGVVNVLSVGTGSTTYSGYRAVVTSGQYGFYELAMGAYKRWRFSMDSSAVNTIDSYTSGGAFIDSPWSCANAAGSPIVLGGAHASTKRDVNLTKDLQLSGTTRLSAAGRIDITSLYNSAWAGAGIRPLLTDNVGMGYATGPLTFRGAIGVKERAYAQIYRTGAAVAQSIPNGTTYTKITPFNTNDTDYLDATPDQANDRIVIGRAGRYHIVFSRSFSVGTANTTWLSAVLKNGTAVPASIQQVKMVNATTSTYATSDCQVTCAAGDVITFGVQHGNGSAVDMTYDYSTLYVDALD